MAGSYTFEKGELSLGDKIYDGISSISIGQPTNRSAIKGAKATPKATTSGDMDLGEMSVTWSDIGQMIEFVEELGRFGPYREVEFGASYVMSAPGLPSKTYDCFACYVNDAPIDASTGEATSSSMPCTFESHKINGVSPHSN